MTTRLEIAQPFVLVHIRDVGDPKTMCGENWLWVSDWVTCNQMRKLESHESWCRECWARWLVFAKVRIEILP